MHSGCCCHGNASLPKIMLSYVVLTESCVLSGSMSVYLSAVLTAHSHTGAGVEGNEYNTLQYIKLE